MSSIPTNLVLDVIDLLVVLEEGGSSGAVPVMILDFIAMPVCLCRSSKRQSSPIIYLRRFTIEIPVFR